MKPKSIFLGTFDHACIESDQDIVRQFKLALLYLGKGIINDGFVFGRFAFSRLFLDDDTYGSFLRDAAEQGQLTVIMRAPERSFLDSVKEGTKRGCAPDLGLHESEERFWRIAKKLDDLGCKFDPPPPFQESGSRHFADLCGDFFLGNDAHSCLNEQNDAEQPDARAMRTTIVQTVERFSNKPNLGRRDFEGALWGEVLGMSADFSYADTAKRAESDPRWALFKNFYDELITLHQGMYIRHCDAGASFPQSYSEQAAQYILSTSTERRILSTEETKIIGTDEQFDPIIQRACEEIFLLSIDRMSVSDILRIRRPLTTYLEEVSMGSADADAVLLKAIEAVRNDLAREIVWRFSEKPAHALEDLVRTRRTELDKRIASLLTGVIWNAFFTIKAGSLKLATVVLGIRAIHEHSIRRGLVNVARSRLGHTARNVAIS